MVSWYQRRILNRPLHMRLWDLQHGVGLPVPQTVIDAPPAQLLPRLEMVERMYDLMADALCSTQLVPVHRAIFRFGMEHAFDIDLLDSICSWFQRKVEDDPDWGRRWLDNLTDELSATLAAAEEERPMEDSRAGDEEERELVAVT